MSAAPRVTLALFCYNQEKYIEQAFSSCLAQDYSNLRIVVSDDASSDGTMTIVKQMLERYDGAHDVVINQNPQNMGIGRHFAFVMDNLLEGDLVVMCAGDDVSKPNRVTRVVQEWLSANKPSLVAHGLEEIDENGCVMDGAMTFQYKNQDQSMHTNNMYSLIEYQKYHFAIHFVGAAVAYRVDSYQAFGTPVTYPDCEDHLMYFRALLTGGVHYFPEVLTGYRKHETGWTSQPMKPFHHLDSPLLSAFLDKDQKLDSMYVNCYATHQIVTQQWYDYVSQVRSGNVRVDYQLVDTMWKNLLRRHKFLIRNKGRGERFRIWLGKFRASKKRYTSKAKIYRMGYLPPLNTVVFGTALGAWRTLRDIGPGFNVMYACNTDPELSGKEFFGLEIIGLQRLGEIIDTVDCILVASGYYFKIKRVLMEQGNISESKIVRVPASVIVGD